MIAFLIIGNSSQNWARNATTGTEFPRKDEITAQKSVTFYVKYVIPLRRFLVEALLISQERAYKEGFSSQIQGNGRMTGMRLWCT